MASTPAVARNHFWAIDVEGNGGRPPEIVELAAVEVVNLELSGRQRQWLVRPRRPIQPMATRIHGLTDDDVAGAPTIEEAAEDVLQTLSNTPVVGHNARVELDVVSRSISGWNPRNVIDTLKLAKAIRPDLASYALGALGAIFGRLEDASRLTNRRHHSAFFDATLTALIFLDLLRAADAAHLNDALLAADILNPRQARLL